MIAQYRELGYAANVKGLIGIEGFSAGSGGDPALVKTRFKGTTAS